jgi:hypothetical protein
VRFFLGDTFSDKPLYRFSNWRPTHPKLRCDSLDSKPTPRSYSIIETGLENHRKDSIGKPTASRQLETFIAIINYNISLPTQDSKVIHFGTHCVR